MKRFSAAVALGLATTLGGCATLPDTPVPAVQQQQREPVTILISIDGFRADYLDRGVTPTLSALAADGTSASMYPSFPSKTFPNHWAAVTGYVPDHSGITANGFSDPARADEKFTMATTDPFYWNDKEPIWVTAEKAGVRTAAMFWPGSAVAWGGEVIPNSYGKVDGGTRPQDWAAFDQAITPTQRVNTVLDWLRRPADIRPQFITLYFDEVDTAGHEAGPDSDVVQTALRNVDADIATLMQGLAELNQPANIVITSDHGMAEVRNSRTVELNSLIAQDNYQLVETGPYATMNPLPGHEAELEEALIRPHDHMACWNKRNIPARYSYGTNPRIPEYLCLADMGWQIFASRREEEKIGGNHGFDPFSPEMAAIFIANGPAFRRGERIDTFNNVDINPLMRALLGLPQDVTFDGQFGTVREALEAAE